MLFTKKKFGRQTLTKNLAQVVGGRIFNMLLLRPYLIYFHKLPFVRNFFFKFIFWICMASPRMENLKFNRIFSKKSEE